MSLTNQGTCQMKRVLIGKTEIYGAALWQKQNQIEVDSITDQTLWKKGSKLIAIFHSIALKQYKSVCLQE